MNKPPSNRTDPGGKWWMFLLLLAVVLPFGEGGATPESLLVNHTLILMTVGLALLTHGTDPDPLPLGIAWGIPLFLSVLLISSWGSPYPYASFLRVWDLGMGIALFWVARRLPRTETQREILLDGILVTATLQAMGVLGGLISGRLTEILGRFGLLNSNHQAAYLNLVLFLTVVRLAQGRPWIRMARGTGLLLCLTASCLLASRGAWLGLGVGSVVLMIGARKKLSRVLHRATMLSLLAVLLAGAVGIWSRFSTSEDLYRYERLRIWKADVRCFSGQPVLGIGPGIFWHVSHRYNFPLPGPVRYERSFHTPHSDLLGLLVETGMLGCGVGALVVLSIGLCLARSAREGSLASLGMLAGLMAMGIQGGVDDLTRRPAILLTLALLVSLTLSRERDSALSAPKAPRRWFWLVPSLFLLWMVAVWNPYSSFRADRQMRRAGSLSAMEERFATTIAANPFQSDSYRFPVSAFLAARPEAPLTLDLYERFRHDLDRGLSRNRVSADLEIALARLETRAWTELFFDDFTRDRALAAYRAAVRKAPLDPRPRVELAGFLRSQGRIPEALEQTERALETEPIYHLAHLQRIRLLMDAGEMSEARAAWERLRALRQDLLEFRPTSPYAADLVRVSPEKLQELEESLAGSR